MGRVTPPYWQKLFWDKGFCHWCPNFFWPILFSQPWDNWGQSLSQTDRQTDKFFETIYGQGCADFFFQLNFLLCSQGIFYGKKQFNCSDQFQDCRLLSKVTIWILDKSGSSILMLFITQPLINDNECKTSPLSPKVNWMHYDIMIVSFSRGAE